MKKVRLGIIGCGNISRAHMLGYKLLPNVELVACCDIDIQRAERFQQEYGFARAYTFVDQIIEREDLDAVSVCTWNSAHSECAIAAMRGGANVLCEKPLAMDARQAEEMARVSAETGKLLMVGFCRRFGENVQFIKRCIDRGDFGEIYYAKTGCVRRVGNPGGWFSDKGRSGGGPLIDLGVHMIDMARYLMGKPKAVSVTGHTFYKLGARANIRGVHTYHASDWSDFNDVEDLAVALIRFDNGACLFVENSWTQHLDAMEQLYLEVYGDKSGAEIEPNLRMMGETNDYLMNMSPVIDQGQAPSDSVFAKETNHFIDCVANGIPCTNPAEDGVELMRILDSVYESARLGKEIVLPR